MKYTTVSAVIVTYNSSQYITACINSLKKQKFSGQLEVIVIDNNSQDGSQKLLSKISRIKFFPQDTNLGFSKANNIGLKNASGEFVLFINPDTKILTGAIQKMMDIFNTYMNVGIVGCQMYWNDSKHRQRCCSGFPTPLSCIFEYTILGKIWKNNPILRDHWLIGWDRQTFRYVDVIHGGAFMVRKEVAEKVEGFDENYFLYFEEADLCRRVRNVGYLAAFTPKAGVIHYGGQSSKSEEQSKILNIFEVSRRYYLKKFYGLPTMLVVETLIFIL